MHFYRSETQINPGVVTEARGRLKMFTWLHVSQVGSTV